MFKDKVFKSKFLNLGLVCAFILLFFPVEVFSQDSLATGSLVGYIYKDDFQTPIENAVVYLRNIENKAEYQSTPSDEIGLYTVKDVAEGRYVLGISSDEGNFNLDYSVLIKADEIAKLSIATKPGGDLEGGQEGGNGDGNGFFKTAAGIALLIGMAGGLAFGLYKLLEKKEEPSPSTKK